MSDDEADPELLELLRQHLRGSTLKDAPPSTGVLKSAEYVYDNSIDVALDMRSTKAAARLIHDRMQKSQYSTKNWASHDLHPKTKDDSTLNFIFTMDLQNFSFWSERNAEERFAIEYKGQRWTGYWSLVAGLQRALDEGIFYLSNHILWLIDVRNPNNHLRLLAKRTRMHPRSPATYLPLHHHRRNATPPRTARHPTRSRPRLVHALLLLNHQPHPSRLQLRRSTREFACRALPLLRRRPFLWFKI